MSAARTLLVTGGGGFVMGHLVRRWLDAGPRARSVVVDAAPLDAPARRFLEPVAERMTFVRGDVTDPALWDALSRQHAIDFAVHGAAVTSIDRQVHADGPGRPGFAGARSAVAANALGTYDALGWAASHRTLRRFVYVSSGSVYADEGPDPLPEDGFVAPRGLYATTKHAGELFTACATRDLGLDAVSVRLSGVFGPLDRVTTTRDVRSAPRALVEGASAKRPVRVRSLDGAGDFVHAEDVADAIVSILEAPALRHRVYNVASGSLASVGEMIGHITERVPAFAHEVIAEGDVDVDLGAAARPGRFGAYDVARLRADTGWSPRPLREALHDYVDAALAG